METDSARIDLLSTLWSNFAEREAGPYSPMYSAIARAVAADRRLLARVIEDAPPAAHMPITLLAAVHDVVLREPLLPLAAVYHDGTVAVAPQRFVELCDGRWPDIVEVLQHRRVQTNECGRSAPIALALAKVTEAVGPLDGLVDAGASAGLNLLYDRFCLDYGAFGCLGDPTSAVRVACEVTAPPGYRLPAAVPDVPTRVGLDHAPIDVTDEADRRWLLACTWPDTGRLERTAAALAVAAANPPEVRRGGMVTDLAATVDSLPDGRVCVLTSWAAGYLSRADLAALLGTLDDLGERRDVVWLSLEIAGLAGDLTLPTDREGFDIEPSAVVLTRFHRGTRRARLLGLVHPHGRAVRWL